VVSFAYDGSIDGDWVSRYAIQIAAHESPPRLHLVHVREHPDKDILSAKIQRIEHECRLHHVDLTINEKNLQHDLFTTLFSMLPSGAPVICGMRSKPHKARKRGFLTDTIAERLLNHEDLDVLALRALHPGLLGAPHELLLPVHEQLPRPQLGIRFLRLLAPGINHIQILELISTGGLAYRLAFRSWLMHQREDARGRLKVIEDELAKMLNIGADCFDTTVRLSPVWPHELLICASRHKSQLIVMGLPHRTLVQRFNHSSPVEDILRDATCDVAIFGGKR